MKLFDIVNIQDEVIGSATAQECHANPALIHRAVHFTLFDRNTNRLLITQRSPQVKFDSGMWCFMGEHVLCGENYEQTVWKGLQDELGITRSTDIELAELGHHIFSYDTQTELVRFFIVKADFTDLKLQPDENEIVDLKWLSLQELLENKDSYTKMTRYWLKECDWLW